MKKSRKSYPKHNLTEQRFGKLVAKEWQRGGYWKCVCDCGNRTVVPTKYLLSGHTKSCGCKNYETKNLLDMTGYETKTLKVLQRMPNKYGQTMWECECKYCGTHFTTKGSSIRNGACTSCGCLKSKNELKISKLLDSANINYIPQYTFSDLYRVKGHPLRFDFAIFKDNKLSHLIEFNGTQHYERPKGSWASSFELYQERDQMKIDYCKSHNIELRVIPYDCNYTLEDLI